MYQTIAVISGTVLLLGVIAGYIKNRLWLAEPMVCVLVGILVGPASLGIVGQQSLGSESAPHLRDLAQLTLGIAVMGAALRLPARYELLNFRDLSLSLVLGLPLMWLTSAAAAWFLGLPALQALLLGAILAPTDPVVANSITGGRLAERALPARVRNLLTCESGANDGLALPFVLLPVLLMTEPPSSALTEWLGRVVLWEVFGAVAIGLFLGWLSGRILAWAYRQPFSDHHSMITVGLALSLTVLSTVHLMGSDGILAVFAAGLVLNRFVTDAQTRHEHVQEAIGRFFDLPVFILFGAMLPWRDWMELGWPAVAFSLSVIALRRLPWWLVLGRHLKATATWREAAFLGWFGPVGIAGIYYALLAQEKTGLEYLWPVTSLVVCASIIAHGVSATPVTRAMGKGNPVDEAPHAK